MTEDIYRIYGYYIGGKRKRALSYIGKINPAFNGKNLDCLIALSEGYIVSSTTMRHIGKTINALHACKGSGNSAWMEAISLIRAFRKPSTFCDGSDPTKKHNKLIYQLSLLLEVMSRIRLRPDQVEKIHFIFSSAQNGGKNSGVLIQQLMGSGKSKALIPALVLMGLCMKRKRRKTTTEGNLDQPIDEDQDAYLGYPVIVSHITQLPAVLKELPPILSQLNLTVEYIDMNFTYLKTLDGIIFLHGKLESILKNRTCVPVFTSAALMAWRTLFRSINTNATNYVNIYLNEH
ncbi:MAG: hypothetical protein LBI69_00075 [Puniceicoccales bacterium]|nr:hypothetical protein [Puniceicoccales bacterium]